MHPAVGSGPGLSQPQQGPPTAACSIRDRMVTEVVELSALPLPIRAVAVRDWLARAQQYGPTFYQECVYRSVGLLSNKRSLACVGDHGLSVVQAQDVQTCDSSRGRFDVRRASREKMPTKKLKPHECSMDGSRVSQATRHGLNSPASSACHTEDGFRESGTHFGLPDEGFEPDWVQLDSWGRTDYSDANNFTFDTASDFSAVGICLYTPQISLPGTSGNSASGVAAAGNAVFTNGPDGVPASLLQSLQAMSRRSTFGDL
eukprot:jgi/Ulvmu1/2855/UM145_0010.1